MVATGILAIVFLVLLWAVNRPVSPPLPDGITADYILIEKAARRMTIFADGKEIRSYRVSLGRGGLAPKQREGDLLVPEGRYRVEARNPASTYHLSLKISYPDAADRAAAATRGESAGSNIMIHGIRNGLGWLGRAHLLADWTAGCIALTNGEMQEVWRIVPDGAAVEIRP
ncbi:MAG: L,D-transpeptidase family protein [Parvibaculum sp.]